ncbi:hypothetical protein VYU27_006968 [Nannochloropsis oceanica]
MQHRSGLLSSLLPALLLVLSHHHAPATADSTAPGNEKSAMPRHHHVMMNHDRALRKPHKVQEEGTHPATSILLTQCYEPSLASQGFTREVFPYCSILNEGTAVLYWAREGGNSSDVTDDTGSLILGLVTKGQGVGREGSWLALGISSQSMGMKGMDLGMDGTIAFDDRFSRDFEPPTVDAEQSKLFLRARTYPLATTTSTASSPPSFPSSSSSAAAAAVSLSMKEAGQAFLTPQSIKDAGSSADQAAALVFSMPINNCKDEDEDTRIFAGRDMFVMWAWGELDSHDEPHQHGDDSMGGARVPLLTTPQAWTALHQKDDGASPTSDSVVLLPASHRSFTVALPPMALPTAETTYMCMFFQPPQDTKFHIYNFKLTDGQEDVNEAYVHHMGIYSTGDNTPAHKPGQPFECSRTPDMGLPIIINDRNSWSTPSPLAYQSVDAGIPFGKGYDKYWMLEVHFIYGNSAENKRINQAGFVIDYSPTLRQHDMGAFVMGAPATVNSLNFTSNLIVHPGQHSFDYLSYCPPGCSQRYLSEKEGKAPVPDRFILHAHLHMHTLATGGEIQLLRTPRNSTALERTRLYHRSIWDYNNPQGVTYASPGIPYLSGDSFLTRCTYDSSRETETVVYGPTTADEMCLSLVFYYPAPPTAPSVLCFDYEGVSSPSVDFLRSKDKLTVGQCQSAHDFANMTANPELRDTITMLTGLIHVDNAVMKEVKDGFNDSSLALCEAKK